jgi:hypothetical protein
MTSEQSIECRTDCESAFPGPDAATSARVAGSRRLRLRRIPLSAAIVASISGNLPVGIVISLFTGQHHDAAILLEFAWALVATVLSAAVTARSRSDSPSQDHSGPKA